MAAHCDLWPDTCGFITFVHISLFFQANTDNSGSSSSNSNNANTEDMSMDRFQQLSDRSDRIDADLQRIRDQVSLHLKKTTIVWIG